MMKLFIAGDETAANNIKNMPTSGWGLYLKDFLTPNIEIFNYAEAYKSTRAFIGEGRLFQIETEIEMGDYLLISFAQNDFLYNNDGNIISTLEFSDHLLRFASCALNKHAMPIFISPYINRKFSDSKLNDSDFIEYINAMKDFCKLHQYPFIDLYQISKNIISKFGIDDSKRMYLNLDAGEHKDFISGLSDNHLLSPYGAKTLASVIAIELRKYI